MSWMDLQFAISRFWRNRPYQADVEMTEFRKAIGLLWYLGEGDEKLTAEGLGATIDDYLVEFIWLMLLRLETGNTTTDYFRWTIGKVQEDMLEDTALRAFKLTRQGSAEPRLASESYLYLARRHALDGGVSPPTLNGGRRFVRVFLARFKEKENWDVDWDIQGYSRFWADYWWRNPYPNEHRVLIRNSPLSAAAWDTLQLICGDAVKWDRTHLLPPEILQWRLRASFGRPKRPDEGSIPPYPISKFGAKIRYNEMKHTAELLHQVGMLKKDAFKAMAEELHYAETTIRSICGKPYWTLDDLGRDGQKRFEPALYSLLYGPDSNSGTTG